MVEEGVTGELVTAAIDPAIDGEIGCGQGQGGGAGTVIVFLLMKCLILVGGKIESRGPCYGIGRAVPDYWCCGHSSV